MIIEVWCPKSGLTTVLEGLGVSLPPSQLRRRGMKGTPHTYMRMVRWSFNNFPKSVLSLKGLVSPLQTKAQRHQRDVTHILRSRDHTRKTISGTQHVIYIYIYIYVVRWWARSTISGNKSGCKLACVLAFKRFNADGPPRWGTGQATEHECEQLHFVATTY